MGARDVLGAEAKILASAKLTIAAPGTSNFNFGSPTDIYLPTVGGSSYKSGDRLLLVCTATCVTPTTSTLTWSVQDAPDNAGVIDTGNLAAATTDATGGTLAGGTADDYRCIGVLVQAYRPWLRVRATHATATDSFVCSVILLALPGGL